MKELLITSRYSSALLDFIQNEITNCDKELEGTLVSNDDFIKEEDFYLYDCFQSLNKEYAHQELETIIKEYFPFGILVAPGKFSYDIMKKYIIFLAKKYNYNELELFFDPSIFFKQETDGNLVNYIQDFFQNYKNKNCFLENLQENLKNKKEVTIIVNESKLLKTKLILNVTDKNKELIELFLDEGIINGNSVINYAGKDILLIEYLILRSLSCSSNIIKIMLMQLNKKNAYLLKDNLEKMNLSYLDNFPEQAKNYKDNVNFLERKIIELKFEDKEKTSSGTGSKGVVKI